MRVYSVGLENRALVSSPKIQTAKASVKQNSATNVLISFTGNELHDITHGISISVEDNLIGLDMYKCGGAGAVGCQLPEALNKNGGMNMKHVVPYYSHNNPKGGIKVLFIPERYDLNKLPDKMPENLFLQYPVDMSLEEIANRHKVTPDRIKFVLQDEPQSVPNPQTYISNTTKELTELKESPYRILIPTEVSGTIQRIDENSLGNLKTIPYKVYKIALPNGKDANGNVIYNTEKALCVHTPDMAKFQKAYTYSPELKEHPHVNLFTRDFGDASADMLPKLNQKEFGYHKPANVIAHCRTGFPITESIINRSQTDPYYRGFKMIDIFHNPMPNYQGTVSNPLDFLRYKATPEDFLELAKRKEFPSLMSIDSHRYNMNKEESELVDRVIKPFLQYYIDDNGNYNHSITPLIARKANPQSVSANHVSHTFAREVLELNDIARGLTNHFREAEKAGDKIEGRPNGCNIDFMKINDPNATMGKNNGISKDMKWYTPYDPKTDSGTVIAKSKRKNTKAFLNMFGEASKSRLDKLSNFTNASVDDKLNRLIYSEDLIKKQRYVLGGLSEYHPKDILWMGWGRSDSQKGYPATLEGFYRFLANKNIPQKYKTHAKLLLGSGADPWPMDDKGVGDFHKIKDIMYKIQTLDGGKYKLNAAYANGFFPNRLVTCATYGIFTSTGEPQGLTVPEALQSGTPTGSINTGGAGEMIVTAEENASKANGFKTKSAYMKNIEDLFPPGTDFSKLTGEMIEEKRLDAAADEVAEMFEEMAKLYYDNPKAYAQMAENAGRCEFDWHNNQMLNKGRSTLQLYTEDGFEIQKGMEARSKKPMRRLVGQFAGKFEELKRNVQQIAEEKAPAKQKESVILSNIDLNDGSEYSAALLKKLDERKKLNKQKNKKVKAKPDSKIEAKIETKAEAKDIKKTKVKPAKSTKPTRSAKPIKLNKKVIEVISQEAVQTAANTATEGARRLRNKWTSAIMWTGGAIAATGVFLYTKYYINHLKHLANQKSK